MENNTLISMETITKEKFNEVEIPQAQDVSAFLLFFMNILQIAVVNKLITEEKRNYIGELITNAIAEEVDDEEEFIDTRFPIANYMYVVTLYLQSMTNWNAWVKLSKINSLSNAFIFIREAKDWFLIQVESLDKHLNNAKKDVSKIKFGNVLEAYKNLKKILSELKMFNLPNKINLKERHSRSEGFGSKYFTLKDSKEAAAPNYLKKVQIIVYSFCTEVSIMSKMNTKELESFRRNERKNDLVENDKRAAELEKEMSTKLKKLKEKFLKELETTDDEIALEKKYKEDKAKINEEWLRRENNLNEDIKFSDIMKGDLIRDDVSLQDLIKEFAIFQLANKGKIKYPATMEERGMALDKLEIKDAISEFLDSNIVNLNDIEIDYLKSI